MSNRYLFHIFATKKENTNMSKGLMIHFGNQNCQRQNQNQVRTVTPLGQQERQ